MREIEAGFCGVITKKQEHRLLVGGTSPRGMAAYRVRAMPGNGQKEKRVSLYSMKNKNTDC